MQEFHETILVVLRRPPSIDWPLGVMPRGAKSASPSEIVTEFLLRSMAQLAQLTRDNPKI